ncbi:MAG: TRAP transporter permease [Acidaminobacteraceae bacterium]
MSQIDLKPTLDDEKQQEMMAKFDREFAYRKLDGINNKIVYAIAIIWSLFQLYTATFGLLPPVQQRSIHVGFALILIFLLYPRSKKDNSNKVKWYDMIFIAGSFGVVFYLFKNFEPLMFRAGAYTDMDFYISLLAVILVIEATRRVAGPILVCVSGFFLVYALFGQYFPGFFSHGGYSIKRITTYGWISSESILGIPISVSASFIFLFLLFATFLKKTGIGDWLTNLALAVAGSATGGPAKAAIIASASQGTISGSSVANTVGTGSVTIPLMKSIGYRPEFAAAVEAAASTGGQLMPPIMGAAAFIMTEFTDLPYSTIALGASIPAFLYFAGIFIMVHLEAKKNGLEGIPKERLPKLKVLGKQWYLSLPIFLIVALLIMKFTPMRAALFGIISSIFIGFIHDRIDEEASFKFKDIVMGLEEGARSALPVVMACASAGIIVGVVTLTGLGIKFANGIVDLAGGSILLTMFLTMIASIVLGMGMPTTANYIVQATIAAPALVAVGVPVLAAHLFVFYFGIIADITPPVALAAFAGAGIAASNPFKTGVQASMLAFAAYLVPYVFATSPELVLVFDPQYTTILLGSKFITVAVPLTTALVGMYSLAGGVTGFLLTHIKAPMRILLIATGLALVQTNLMISAFGLLVFAGLYIMQRSKFAKQSVFAKG